MESTPAILLRRTRFSETSLIVTWLTRDHGKLKTMARGVLRPKSPLAGALDLFFETEIAFVRSRRSEIHTLREVVLRNPFEGLRKDYARVELAAYFVELLEAATEPEHPVPELFDLLHRALAYLETAAPSRRALLHFENELARLLGIHGEAGTGSAASALARACSRLPSARPGLLHKLP
ncbi:MAG: DNA repair protein RecO [Chthoniobacteraceae bacterium]|nr:DNA repair protein RecO [Chthoniobacteraceae bacterium]